MGEENVKTALAVVVDAEIEEPAETPPAHPMVEARADVLLPFLVYVRKLMRSVQSTHTNGPSRLRASESCELTLSLKGFTPEDFNALQSLTNSVGVELAERLDRIETPQMRRDVFVPRRLRTQADVTKYLKVKEGDE